MDLIVTKYNLATRQANSFRMVARHFLLEESAPLLFHFGGVAGTGKSHVVLAISKLFEICQKPELFMKVSYMGCAASLIGGSSICQELCLMSKSITLSVNDDNLCKIMDTFRNIRYFLIDEVYTLDCNNLSKVYTRLQQAKNSMSVFGGLSIITCGDNHQFEPVKGLTIGREYDDTHTSATHAGRSLFVQISQKCIILDKNFRSLSDPVYLGIQQRFLQGKVTFADCDLLNENTVSNRMDIDLTSSDWINAPCIVNRNSLRLKINDERAHVFSCRTGFSKPFLFEANHFIGKKVITDIAIQTYLLGEKEDKFNRLPSKLVLCPGMPLMITENVNVSLGLVNGAYCSFYGLSPDCDFKDDGNGKVLINGCPSYILVKLDPIGEYGNDSDSYNEENNYGYRFAPLSSLPPGVVPVFPKKASYSFSLSGKHISITRRSFQLQLRFAFTDIKSQGASMTRAILDLTPPPDKKGSSQLFNSIYVILSRTKKLKDTLLLRRVEPSFLMSLRPHPYLIKENCRLEERCRLTLLNIA